MLSPLGGLGSAPASAESYDDYSFRVHAPGYPATDVAAHRLDGAFVTRQDAGDSSNPVTVSAMLQAPPDAATDAVLVVRMGHRGADGACEPDWEVTTSTFEPAIDGGSAERDGAEILVGTTAPAGDTWTCGTVTLTDAAGTVTDVLHEPQHGAVISDPAGRATIDAVSGKRVPVRRWAVVWVRVTNQMSPVDRVLVRGLGRGVDVRQATTGPLAEGESVVLPVQVRLRADERRQVRLSARADGQVAFAQTTRRVVWLRPRR